MTLRAPASIEELLYSYIAHLEAVATDVLESGAIRDTDYERVIVEHRLFAARVAAAGAVPRPIHDRCAALRLPRRPTRPKSWRDVLAAIEWILGRVPNRLGDRNPHEYYHTQLDNYVEDLRVLRQAVFFAFNETPHPPAPPTDARSG